MLAVQRCLHYAARMPATLPAAFVEQVRSGFPADFLSTEPADLTEFGKDWTRVSSPAPAAIVFPRSTDEVSRLLKLCNTHDVKVVPSGGRTGLAAGAMAANGELVVSLKRMNRIRGNSLESVKE